MVLASLWHRVTEIAHAGCLRLMQPQMLVAAALLSMPAAPAIGLPEEVQENAAGQVHTEIPYRDGIVKLTSDYAGGDFRKPF